MTTRSATRTKIVSYVKTIGIVNNAPVGRGFANPWDLKVSRDGRIFVLNRGAPVFSRVGVCNLNEDYLYEFGSHGDGDGQFRLPAGIALDSKQERVFVTDEHNHRVSIFDAAKGEFLGKWGTHGSDGGELNGPAGIAMDSDDNVYIADQNNHRVQKFTSDGKLLAKWGEHGSGEGQLNMPWGICLDSEGNVYVADWRNDRIQKFSPGGEFVASFGKSGQGEGQFRRPSSVAVDGDGNIYVADWGNERVQILGPRGGFRQLLRGEATLSKWAMDFFSANPDEWKERGKSDLLPKLPPHLNTPYHISSQTEPYFWGPASVNLDGEGRLYVTETARHRVQIYQK
ncbi:MAG: NHL repeat-containing protein [Chloroflexi bacterium]|nr:NHL repeat-containing protein [Chloroflexota bacterium]